MVQSNIFLDSSFSLFLPLLSLKSSLTQILPNHFASPQRASWGFPQELGLLFSSPFIFLHWATREGSSVPTSSTAHSQKCTKWYTQGKMRCSVVNQLLWTFLNKFLIWKQILEPYIIFLWISVFWSRSFTVTNLVMQMLTQSIWVFTVNQICHKSIQPDDPTSIKI